MNYFIKQFRLWFFRSFRLGICALSVAMLFSSCSVRTARTPSTDYSRYKTIKIDVMEASLSESGQPSQGSHVVSLSPLATNRYQQGFATMLQQRITNQTKLRIVNDDIADLMVGFYLSKSYNTQQGRLFNQTTQDASSNSSLGFPNATTAIVNVILTDNVLSERHEFDVTCNGFLGPAGGGDLSFIDHCAEKAAKETFKRISTMTK